MTDSATSSLIYSLSRQHALPTLDKPHLTFSDIEPVIKNLSRSSIVRAVVVGHSFNGVPIYRLSVGTGPLTLLGWTQMHGDEPTATAGVLDWLNIVSQHADALYPFQWQDNISVHFLVMLNPDGAATCTRENAQGLDINRDARALQTPEGALLHQQVKQLRPNLALNLHDQNAWYRAGNHSRLASTLAFLAPPFDAANSIDDKRRFAMQLIATLHHQLRQSFQVGMARYVDNFSARCFGDTIAASTPTILIESGACPGDPHRQTARQMNVVALHYAVLGLLRPDHLKPADNYHLLEENIENGMHDLILRHVRQTQAQTVFYSDIGINKNKQSGTATIAGIGDLADQGAFEEVNCDNLTLMEGKVYRLTAPLVLNDTGYRHLLRQGYNTFSGSKDLLTQDTKYPVIFVKKYGQSGHLATAQRPALLLGRDQTPELAVLDATVVYLS